MTPPHIQIVPSGPLAGSLPAPASKSVTNRLLLLAALADGTSLLHGPLVSDDSAAMRGVIEGLGATVTDVGQPDTSGHAWRVDGVGGRVRPTATTLDCRLSGTTIRFGTAVAALSPHDVTLTGQAPLRRRPLGPLSAALRALGARAHDHDGFPPVTVGGGLAGGAITVDASGSSQFASAVLLAAPHARTDVDLTATGVHAGAYVDLTVAAMADWGAQVTRHGAARWTVAADTGYQPREQVVEYDASAAAHLYALAVASGGRVTVEGTRDTLQPDAGIAGVLTALGATVHDEGPQTTVEGPERPVPAGTVDLAAMPDQVTTVAALAALADGVTTITGVEVARGHETDRLAALATELRKLGTGVEERPDGLVVDGSTSRGHASLATYHDHRLAMAFAAVGTRLPGVIVQDPGCVAKTYPGFWQALVRLGGEVRTP